MNYSEVHFLSLIFLDGIQDPFDHPYVVMLDSHNKKFSKVLLVKCKTFDPIKHSLYLSNGNYYGPIMLRRKSIVNLQEVFEVDYKPNNPDLTLAFNIFSNIGFELYKSNASDNLSVNCKDIFKPYNSLLEFHLNKHGLIPVST